MPTRQADGDGGSTDWAPISTPACAPAAAAQLIEAANGIAELDWSSVVGPDLMRLRESLERVTNAVESAEASFVAALDESKEWLFDGHRGVKGCLRITTTRPDSAVTALVSTSKILRRMPVAADAHAAGLIGRRHVALLHSCTASWFGSAFDDAEATLVGWAVEYDWPSFASMIAAWKEAADLRAPSTADEQDQQARVLHHSRSFRGRGLLDGTLTPVAAEILDETLRPIIDELFTADWRAAREKWGDDTTEAHLERTPAQRRHDAFEELCRRAAAWNGVSRARPLYMVHLTIDDLRHALALDAGLPSRPPPPEASMRRFGSGFRVSPTSAVQGIIDAHVRRIVFDADGEVLDLGRSNRFFTRAQKLAMAARDAECVCGCGLRADLCEADHRIDWRFLGETNVRDGQSMCPPSHRRKTADPSWVPPPDPHRRWTIAGLRRRRPGRGRHAPRDATAGGDSGDLP